MTYKIYNYGGTMDKGIADPITWEELAFTINEESSVFLSYDPNKGVPEDDKLLNMFL